MTRVPFLSAVICILLLFTALPVMAKIEADDPMVRITTRPLTLNVNEVMAKLSEDVSRDTGIDKKYITYYWQTFDAIYCPSSKDPAGTNVVFVDLYVPSFFTDKDIAGLMTSLADSLVKHTDLDREAIFIQTHFPKDGHVYISGKVVEWNGSKSPQTAK